MATINFTRKSDGDVHITKDGKLIRIIGDNSPDFAVLPDNKTIVITPSKGEPFSFLSTDTLTTGDSNTPLTGTADQIAGGLGVSTFFRDLVTSAQMDSQATADQVFPLMPFTNRQQMPNQNFYSATTPTITYRSHHYVAQKSGMVRLMWVNQSNAGNASNPFTLTASIMVMSSRSGNPSATPRQQLKFNGSVSVVVPVSGYVISDPVWLPSIPSSGDTTVLVYACYSSEAASNNWPIGLAAITSRLDGQADGDQTMTNPTFSGVTNSLMPAPSLIGTVLPSGTKSLCIIGDSIADGAGDSMNCGFSGHLFYTHKWSGNRIAVAGERCSTAKTLGTPRWQLCSQATHIICQHGTNDIGNGATAATLKADMIEMWGNFARLNKKVIQLTILPRATSSDSWQTAANQTPWTYDSVRIDLNDWLRSGAYCLVAADGTVTASTAATAGAVRCPYLYRTLDICSTTEVDANNVLTTNGGRWKVGDVLLSSTVTGSGSNYIQDTNTNFNALNLPVARALVRITSGNAVGALKQIDGAGSDTQINMMSTWATIPEIGSTYEILDVPTADAVHPTSNTHRAIASYLNTQLNSIS